MKGYGIQIFLAGNAYILNALNTFKCPVSKLSWSGFIIDQVKIHINTLNIVNLIHIVNLKQIG